MVSVSDSSSSSDEDDSLELQRLKDAAVTLEPDGDLHASQKISTKSNVVTEAVNSAKVPVTRKSLRQSLRPKQTYSEDSGDLKVTPGFRTHVARKLSDILDKELEFDDSTAETSGENRKTSDSGIRLLSSSKKLVIVEPGAEISEGKTDSENPKWNPVWKPRSHSKRANSTGDKSASSARGKRGKKKTGSSSSDSSDDDDMLAEAAISFDDVKKKDEFLSTFAVNRPPILVIKSNTRTGGGTKKKKKKKSKENPSEEGNEDKEKELREKK